jgi:isoquinoline 1-oxidoreductase beta subunit
MPTRPSPAPDLSRRAFLQQSALVTGGLVIAFSVPTGGQLARAQGAGPANAPLSPNAFLRIGADDTLTVLLAHSEMGQGIWTTLPMLVAEELDADWSRIRVEHAPAGDAYRHPVYGMQITGGSTSTWGEFDRYRQVGAMARAMLLQAASARFGAPVADCRTENGVVICGDRRATYGALADDAAKLPAPANVELRKPADWRVIGKPTRRLDAPQKVDGSAQFGLDVRLPGMLTAVVAHPPVFGGTVKSVDDAKALQVAGVRKVVTIPSGVAVIADNFHAARQGRDALTVDWDAGTHAGLDTQALRSQFRALSNQDGASAVRAGDARAALARAAKTIDAEYFVPYLAHAPMEPLNCTVRIENGQCEIWTGTQFQSSDRTVAASITGLAPDKVEIHTTFLGGGFGRRGNPFSDWVAEAVHVAKAAGAPVKTVWTREDDIRGGYYRPMFLHRAKVGLGADGMPVAWDHTLVGQSIAAGTPFESMLVRNGIDGASVEGTADSPYLAAIADRRVELHSPRTGIPVLWWRSVGNTHTAFVMESLIDEAASAAGRDPVDYRRALLKDHPRHLGVLNLAAEKAGWGTRPPEGRARGVAVHECFGSYVAQVAEVSVESGEIRVHRVVCAADCGIVVNPAGVVAQMESGIAFGLSATLAGAIELKEGRVQQSNFHDYPVLRLNQMPAVEVHIVPSTEKSGGAGEPGTPLIAPAVANAIAALTGQRLRELPLRLTA